MTVLRVLLSTEDCERYGLPGEPLELDMGILMQDEAEELDDQGIDPDGKPWVEFLNSGKVKVYRVVVWLALRRAGVDVTLADVKFDRKAVRFSTVGEVEPGKDEDSASSGSPGPDDSSPDTPD
jgi:hypothetical protein